MGSKYSWAILHAPSALPFTYSKRVEVLCQARDVGGQGWSKTGMDGGEELCSGMVVECS